MLRGAEQLFHGGLEGAPAHEIGMQPEGPPNGHQAWERLGTLESQKAFMLCLGFQRFTTGSKEPAHGPTGRDFLRIAEGPNVLLGADDPDAKDDGGNGVDAQLQQADGSLAEVVQFTLLYRAGTLDQRNRHPARSSGQDVEG